MLCPICSGSRRLGEDAGELCTGWFFGVLPPPTPRKTHPVPPPPLARSRLCLASSQTLYLLVNNRGLPNMTVTMQELYRDNKDEDGFLYLTYASQEMFGGLLPPQPPSNPDLAPSLVAL